MPETFGNDDLEELPEWVLAALNRALNRPSAPSVLDHRNGAAWPMLVEASLVSSFLPRDLAPELPDGEQRSEAEKAVLRFAETTYGSNGMQWTLTTQSRCQVVEAAIGTSDLKEAVSHTASRFIDNISEAIRTCVIRSSESVPQVDLKSLEALRIAVSSLLGVSREKLKLPPLDKLDREIALRRLLRQFERMIGRKSDDDADKQDRFFGREAELKILRDYVGVIPATSKFGSVMRGIEQVSRKFKERAPLTVFGVGGAGKTTLISKFMLEHAEAASSKFPFAYLDFERTTVGARQRLDLLAEMCAQVGAQFESLTSAMTALSAEVLKLARDLESKNQFESISEYSTYCLKFRDHVDGMLESLESRMEWARPFLLVFDTFEVVQYAQGDIEAQDVVRGLEEFVQCFSKTNETTTWPRLRLIISGRTQVKKFLGTVEECPVGALDPLGSAQLLVALARDAKRPITDAEATTLVDVVAKAIKEPNHGVQPLRLHLIGEVFRTAKGGGKVVVESLIDELSQPLESHRVAARIWIDGILVRRILGHVNDDRVRALADPGLVVRRITPEVIEKVMTKGTSKPTGKDESTTDTDPDAEITDPWIVDETEAEAIYKQFSKEVTLVEDDNDGLRHRADVRQQMLPLIRARRPKRFRLLNQLAFDYFSKRALENPQDLTACGEAIYHGLWLDQPLETLNNFWCDSQAFRPRIDPADFDDASLAQIYVRAKARSPLTANEVAQLPSAVALEWLEAHCADLLDEHRVDDAIQAIRAAAGSDYAGLDDRTGTAAVLARLLYRAGLWQDAIDLALRHIKAASEDEFVGPDETPSNPEKSARQEALLSLIRTVATVVGKSRGSVEALEKLSKHVGAIRDPMIRVEIAAHIIVGCSQHGNNLLSLRKEVAERVLIPSVPAINPDRWAKDKKVLRLAILCDDDDVKGDGAKAFPELLPLWIAASERVPRDVDQTLLSYLFSQIFKEGPVALEVEEILTALKSQKTRRGAMNRLDELWRKEKSTIQMAVRSRADLKPLMRGVVAADNSDWVRPFGNSLTRALKQDSVLATSLEKAHFRISSTKRDREADADGIAAVQYAMDDGRLLRLAESVVRWNEKNKSGSTTETPTYPQDVFAISGALMHWHVSLNQGDQGMSWEDAPQLESRLKRALDAFDWPGAAGICKEIIDRIKKTEDMLPETTAKRLLSSLRRKRRFTLMRQLADAILKSGVRTPQVRRQYAQALIDEGQFDEAESQLNSIIQDPMGIAGEVTEARGLIGRIYKQRYVNNSSAPAEVNAPNLRRALELYEEVYRLNPKENLWHGINVVALAARARRDGLSYEGLPDDTKLAQEILATLAEKEEQWTVALYAWDEATRMEAYVALGQFRDADNSALRYVDSIDADAFELSSTIRQLTEVWQLNYNEPPGNHLLAILKAAHLSKEGGFSERQPDKVAEESNAVGLAVKDLETLFGTARTVTLKWYKKGLDQCNAVARIEGPDGRGRGTGWLVKASDFFPGREGVLLLTNEHVLSGDPKHPAKALLPGDAQANFQSLDEVLQVKEIVWTSSYKDLDATFVTLEQEPKAPPLELFEQAIEMPQPPEAAPRLYIIGHPMGRDIEFSIQDNHLLASNETLLHYRTPTEPGSSGSPVFESQRWRVVALHHGGSAAVTRIDGGKGTYEANEGIAIRAIRKRIQAG